MKTCEESTLRPSGPSFALVESQLQRSVVTPLLEEEKMRTLVDGLTKVNELVVKLGRFYQAHPETSNEILIKVASNLTIYSLALTQILGLDTTSVLSNAQKAELSKALKDTEELLPGPVEAEVKQSLQGPNIRWEEAMRLFTRQLNLYFAIGSDFLMEGEMKASGFSDAMINSAVSQRRPNVF